LEWRRLVNGLDEIGTPVADEGVLKALGLK
jgi:hypothetical protein